MEVKKTPSKTNSQKVKLLIEKFESMSMRKVHIAGAPQDWDLNAVSGRVAETVAKFEHNIYPFALDSVPDESASCWENGAQRWMQVLKQNMLRHVREQLEDQEMNVDEQVVEQRKLLEQELKELQELEIEKEQLLKQEKQLKMKQKWQQEQLKIHQEQLKQQRKELEQLQLEHQQELEKAAMPGQKHLLQLVFCADSNQLQMQMMPAEVASLGKLYSSDFNDANCSKNLRSSNSCTW